MLEAAVLAVQVALAAATGVQMLGITTAPAVKPWVTTNLTDPGVKPMPRAMIFSTAI